LVWRASQSRHVHRAMLCAICGQRMGHLPPFPSPLGPRPFASERAVTDLNLYWLELGAGDGAGDERSNPGLIFAPSTRTEMDPQFSPDRREVAFASERSGNAAIWLCGRDGSDLIQLTNTSECAAGSPHWSPVPVALRSTVPPRGTPISTWFRLGVVPRGDSTMTLLVSFSLVGLKMDARFTSAQTVREARRSGRPAQRAVPQCR
jgi:WD40-like Beta Propeller Repeat